MLLTIASIFLSNVEIAFEVMKRKGLHLKRHCLGLSWANYNEPNSDTTALVYIEMTIGEWFPSIRFVARDDRDVTARGGCGAGDAAGSTNASAAPAKKYLFQKWIPTHRIAIKNTFISNLPIYFKFDKYPNIAVCSRLGHE